jgi:Transposase, Mutator family
MYVRGLSTHDVSVLYHDTFGANRLSKSTVSRVTQQLNQDFETWRRRDLSDLPVVYLFLDRPYHAARQGSDEKEGVLSAYALLEDGRLLLHLDLGRCISIWDRANRTTRGSVSCRISSREVCAREAAAADAIEDEGTGFADDWDLTFLCFPVAPC